MEFLLKNENNIFPRIKILITSDVLRIILDRGFLLWIESDSVQGFFDISCNNLYLQLGNFNNDKLNFSLYIRFKFLSEFNFNTSFFHWNIYIQNDS